MTIAWPQFPVVGQVVTGPNNTQWTWDGAKWQSTSAIGGEGAVTQAQLDAALANYLQLIGGTLSGRLTIDYLNDTTAGGPGELTLNSQSYLATLDFTTGGTKRIRLAGQDSGALIVSAYQGGNWYGNMMTVAPAGVTVDRDPTTALQVATKQYVDAAVAAGGGGGITQGDLDAALANYLLLTGGTLTGTLKVTPTAWSPTYTGAIDIDTGIAPQLIVGSSTNPGSGTQITVRNSAVINAGGWQFQMPTVSEAAPFLLVGPTDQSISFGNPVTLLAGDPTQPNQAATKHYVDNAVASAIATGFLPLTGGTLTGALQVNAPIATTSSLAAAGATISAANASIIVNKAAAGQAATVYGEKAGLNRWGVVLGDVVLESGGNVGSAFQLNRYDDAGALIDSVLGIDRSTGIATFAHPLYIGGNLVATQAFVTSQLGAFLPLTGGTLSHDLNLLNPAWSPTAYSQLTQNGWRMWNGATARWQWRFGELADDFQNFMIGRYDDLGNPIDWALTINRTTGAATFSQQIYTGTHAVLSDAWFATAAQVYAQVPGSQGVLSTGSLNAALGWVQQAASSSGGNFTLDFTTFVNLVISSAGATINFLPRNLTYLMGRSGLIVVYNGVAMTYAWEAGTNTFDNNTAPSPATGASVFNVFAYSIVPTSGSFATPRVLWTLIGKGVAVT